jgi:ribosomal protein L20A (L18A)
LLSKQSLKDYDIIDDVYKKVECRNNYFNRNITIKEVSDVNKELQGLAKKAICSINWEKYHSVVNSSKQNNKNIS